MKIGKIFLAIPICTILMAAPVTGIQTMAVTVDIPSNYDAGLLSEDSDTSSESKRQNAEDAKESTNDYTSASSSTASSTASSTSSTATSTASSASTTASTVTPTSTSASTTASTTSTDLPKTGDDDRIMITATVLMASLAVFLTMLMADRLGNRT